MAMLKVENCPSNKLAFTNRIFLSKTDFARLKGARARARSRRPSARALRRASRAGAGPDQGTDDSTLLVEVFNNSSKGFVFTAGVYPTMKDGSLGVAGLQRRTAMLELDQEVRVEPFRPAADIALSSITIVINLIQKKAGQKPVEIDCAALSELFKNEYGAQVFTANQKLAINFKVRGLLPPHRPPDRSQMREMRARLSTRRGISLSQGTYLDATIDSLQYADLRIGASSAAVAQTGGPPGSAARGQLLASTEIEWSVPSTGSFVRLSGKSSKRPDLFTSDFDFAKLGAKRRRVARRLRIRDSPGV